MSDKFVLMFRPNSLVDALFNPVAMHLSLAATVRVLTLTQSECVMLALNHHVLALIHPVLYHARQLSAAQCL